MSFKDPQSHAEYLRLVASILEEALPGLGFALFVFEFDKPGRTDYISNAERQTMLKAIEEGIERMKTCQVWTTPGKN